MRCKRLRLSFLFFLTVVETTMMNGPKCRRLGHALVSLLLALGTLGIPEILRAGESPAPGARIHRSLPPTGATSHVVVPGERFRTGSFKRWFLGSDYRDLWTTPVEMPVLDMDAVGGGLTPLRTGGFGQSIALHFTGQDGRRYTVRSLDKDPTKRLDKAYKKTFVESYLQDQISALLPAAGLVTDPLMEAAGILHSPHTLVIIPDDPRLGEYREEFAGLPGTLQMHPSEGPNGTPGFAGSKKISGSDTVWKRLEKGPKERLNARAFLKARFMDFFLNDKDRHPGQWRWARFPKDDGYIWDPIPEDRDQAFIDLDGFAMAVARRGVETQIKFDENLPSLRGLSMSGWEIDRYVLSELERPVWSEVAAELVADLTDSVIDDAVQRLPAPYYEMVGGELRTSLRSRRGQLQKYALRYYRMISEEVEIWATDKDEVAEFVHAANGDLEVRIRRDNSKDPGARKPYFRRTFHPDETDEVRLYLRGGEDHAKISGAKGKIRVRIDGGGGDDTFANASQSGSGDVRFYDSRGNNLFERGKGAKVDERPFVHPPARIINHQRALDWGSWGLTVPLVYANPDLGAFLGVVGGREFYGYRKFPFSSRHRFSLGVATKGTEPFVAYTGTFRHLWPNVDGIFHIEYSGINIVRFNGLGNESELSDDTAFYEVEQREFVFAPSIAFRAGGNQGAKPEAGSETLRPEFTLGIGPILRYADTPQEDNDDKFIGSFKEPIYGADTFGQAGLRSHLAYDSRDNPSSAKRGIHVQAGGSIFPEVWDVEDTFGEVNGSAAMYLSADVPAQPTLAVRAGGKKVWGTYPFQEAAYVGGPTTLRGYRVDRFGGDAMAYANGELRFRLFKLRLLVPGTIGLFAAGDVGRAFFDGDPDDADEWHSAVGGGLWMAFLKERHTLSIGIMDGDDLTGVYVRSGFMF